MANQNEALGAQLVNYRIKIRYEIDQMIRTATPHVIGSAVTTKIRSNHVETFVSQTFGELYPRSTLRQNTVKHNDQRSRLRTPLTDANPKTAHRLDVKFLYLTRHLMTRPIGITRQFVTEFRCHRTRVGT